MRGDTAIVCIETVMTPTPDSRVSVYDRDWKPLSGSSLLCRQCRHGYSLRVRNRLMWWSRRYRLCLPRRSIHPKPIRLCLPTDSPTSCRMMFTDLLAISASVNHLQVELVTVRSCEIMSANLYILPNKALEPLTLLQLNQRIARLIVTPDTQNVRVTAEPVGCGRALRPLLHGAPAEVTRLPDVLWQKHGRQSGRAHFRPYGRDSMRLPDRISLPD